MSIIDHVASYSLIPIFIIFGTIKISKVRHFQIATSSLLFVAFLRLFFYDYPNFELTKVVYLFLLLYALQMLFEWSKLLELMGVIPKNKKDKNN